MLIEKDPFERPRIDLSGPDGNAFVLLGTAHKLLKEKGVGEEKIKEILLDMKSQDYDHLIHVFDQHLGDVVDLVLPPKVEREPDIFRENLKVVDLNSDSKQTPRKP